MTHLVLVGMMGVGKSTVGRIVASELGRPLFDSDDMIEERTGRTVREIWSSDGEPVFRALETDTLLEEYTDDEAPRDSWRLQSLRGWSNAQSWQVPR